MVPFLEFSHLGRRRGSSRGFERRIMRGIPSSRRSGPDRREEEGPKGTDPETEEEVP